MYEQWKGFVLGQWTTEVNVRDFIQKNYTPYEGNDDFLVQPTENTKILWEKVKVLMAQEREQGILELETKTPSSITSHAPGYIAQDLEKIVGLQTDKPLKRGIMPYGGIRVVRSAVEAYGYQLDTTTNEIFTQIR